MQPHQRCAALRHGAEGQGEVLGPVRQPVEGEHLGLGPVPVRKGQRDPHPGPDPGAVGGLRGARGQRRPRGIVLLLGQLHLRHGLDLRDGRFSWDSAPDGTR